MMSTPLLQLEESLPACKQLKAVMLALDSMKDLRRWYPDSGRGYKEE